MRIVRNRSARSATTGSHSRESPSPPCRSSDRRAAPGLVVPEPGAVDLDRRPRRDDSLPRMDFEHVLVVGAGQMGGGIAQVVAASGRRVSLHDAAPGAIERGLATMRKSLDEARGEGRRRPGRGARARRRRSTSSSPADLMIEAVVEDADGEGGRLPRAPTRRCPPAAILASNTSSIPITSLAAATVAARPRDRHALLQPGAGAEARRGRSAGSRPPTRRRRRSSRSPTSSARRRPRRERLPRLRLEPDPDAVHQRGGLRAARRRRRAGGDRHDREARLRAPDGAARARRPDRPRHVRRDHGGAPRRARRPEVRAVPAAPRVRRRRAASAASRATASTRTRSPGGFGFGTGTRCPEHDLPVA